MKTEDTEALGKQRAKPSKINSYHNYFFVYSNQVITSNCQIDVSMQNRQFSARNA